jgi:hypothetical protein
MRPQSERYSFQGGSNKIKRQQKQKSKLRIIAPPFRTPVIVNALAVSEIKNARVVEAGYVDAPRDVRVMEPRAAPRSLLGRRHVHPRLAFVQEYVVMRARSTCPL